MMPFLETFLNFPPPQTLPWFWVNRSHLPHLGVVDVVGATVLSKLTEGLKPGSIREVRADGTYGRTAPVESGYRGAWAGWRSPRVESRFWGELPAVSRPLYEHEAFALSLVDLWVSRFPHRSGPHHLVPIRGFHIGPTGREWGSGSRERNGGGRWSLPSRLGSAGRRNVHIQWTRGDCLGWRPKMNPQLKEVLQAGAALQGTGIDENGPSPKHAPCPVAGPRLEVDAP